MKINDVIIDMHQGINTVADKVEYLDFGIPIIQSKNFTKGYLDLEDVRYLGEEDEKKYIEKYNPHVGDILMANIGTIGKSYVITEEQRFLIAWNAFLIKPNADKIKSEYLKFYFDFLASTHYFDGLLTGGTVKFINKKKIGDIVVPDKTITEQVEICDVLSKVEQVIIKRQQEIELLDNLIKARFVELFGDARENPNGYDMIPFIDIVEYMGDIGSNGANKVVVDHLDMKDEEDYAMMVRFTNFTKNDFSNDVKYISKEAYDFFKKSQIFGGELIICKIGSAGQNYVMPYLNRPVSLGLNQIMVRIKDNILMPYLYQYLHTDYGEFLISGCINGAVTKTITKTELKKIPVMLPPMELQEKFVDFVHQVDKSKFS